MDHDDDDDDDNDEKNVDNDGDERETYIDGAFMSINVRTLRDVLERTIEWTYVTLIGRAAKMLPRRSP